MFGIEASQTHRFSCARAPAKGLVGTAALLAFAGVLGTCGRLGHSEVVDPSSSRRPSYQASVRSGG